MSVNCNCRIKGSKEYNNILELEKFLKVMCDKNRLRIMCFIKDEMHTVTEIQKNLNLPQNVTSNNIAKLKKIGLLNEQREGSFRRYMVNPETFGTFCGIFTQTMQVSTKKRKH